MFNNQPNRVTDLLGFNNTFRTTRSCHVLVEIVVKLSTQRNEMEIKQFLNSFVLVSFHCADSFKLKG